MEIKAETVANLDGRKIPVAIVGECNFSKKSILTAQ